MDESLKMKQFSHRNVLSLIGVCLDAGPAPYIIMPYMANGSLLAFLKKERKSLVLSESTDLDEDVVCSWEGGGGGESSSSIIWSVTSLVPSLSAPPFFILQAIKSEARKGWVRG